jgi:hypothetical protein
MLPARFSEARVGANELHGVGNRLASPGQNHKKKHEELLQLAFMLLLLRHNKTALQKKTQ